MGGSCGHLAKGLQVLWLCHIRSGTASNAKLFFKSSQELNLLLTWLIGVSGHEWSGRAGAGNHAALLFGFRVEREVLVMDHKAFTDLVLERLLWSAKCFSPSAHEQSFIKAVGMSSPHLWHLLPDHFYLLGVNKTAPVLGWAEHGHMLPSCYSSGAIQPQGKSRIFPSKEHSSLSLVSLDSHFLWGVYVIIALIC